MKKILLVEDDAALSWLLEKILRWDYNVVSMKDGLEAWSWLSDGNLCDLIISDVNLPSLQGTELLENLSNSGLYNHIPVIILSGLEESRKVCLELGAITYLLKPFNPHQFLHEVKLAINRQPQYAV